MKHWYKTKFAIYTFVLTIITSVIAAASFYKMEYENKLGVEENDLSPYLYGFYVSKNPQIQDKFFYGNKDASITMIAFLDFSSDPSKNFIRDIFPRIKEDYIDEGNMRYYYKNYITFEDISEKSDNYRYSIAMLCVSNLNKENNYNFYFDLFHTSQDEIPDLIKKYEITETEFDSCVKNEYSLKQLYNNALEIENLGIIGVNQRIYIGIAGKDNTIFTGIPKYPKFQDVIRQYEIQVGN